MSSPVVLRGDDFNEDALFQLRSGSFTEGQTEATEEQWTSSGISVGVWECSVGSFPSARKGRTEIARIISGTASISTDGDGREVQVGPGDWVVLPDGWSGVWHVQETVRKTFVNVQFG